MDNRGVSRLLFQRYLLPFDPWVLLLPVALVGVGLLVFRISVPAEDEAPTPIGNTAAVEDDGAAEADEQEAGEAQGAADGDATADAGPAAAVPDDSGAEGAGPAADAAAAEPSDAREELELTFLGDIMAHSVNFSMDDYRRIYVDVEDELHGDDLTFANLETPVVASHPYETYPRFNVKPEYARAAVEAGVDVFSAANNHAADRGPGGVAATRSALDALDKSIGLGFGGLRSEPGDGFEAVTLEVDGREIGFVAVTQALNGLDGGSLVQTLDYRGEQRVQRFVMWLSRQVDDYDLFVVSYHGGREYELDPDPNKAQFFERLVRAGADIVWSHHPHVVQPWQLLERPDGSEAIILHSTGNFISGQTWGFEPGQADEARAHTGDGALFRVSVEWDKAGKTSISHDPLFVANYRDPRHGMVVRRIDKLIRSDIDESWKRYYVERRVALQKTASRSTTVRLSLLD